MIEFDLEVPRGRFRYCRLLHQRTEVGEAKCRLLMSLRLARVSGDMRSHLPTLLSTFVTVASHQLSLLLRSHCGNPCVAPSLQGLDTNLGLHPIMSPNLLKSRKQSFDLRVLGLGGTGCGPKKPALLIG